MITLENKIMYSFADKALLESSMTHVSYYNEQKRQKKSILNYSHNEKLEFLGDSVLDLILSDLLIKKIPEATEGDLSQIRASLVNEATLTEVAIENGIHSFIRLSKGELQSGGSEKPRIISSALEALIGGIFLDGGYEASRKFVTSLFENKIKGLDSGVNFKMDFKTRLQEISQQKWSKTPEYKVVEEYGPDHSKIFKIAVFLGNGKDFVSVGKSKKDAAQGAAKLALEAIDGI